MRRKRVPLILTDDESKALQYVLDYWMLRPDCLPDQKDPVGHSLVHRLGTHILINEATDGHLQLLIPDRRSEQWERIIDCARGIAYA
jgi:hypothetical protein